jgi:hypothetical protein
MVIRFAVVALTIEMFLTCGTLKAQINNGYETVRIPTASSPRCINSKTDEITLSVYRVTVEKTTGFFTSDNQAGIAVISTLNADGQTSAKTPSVNVVQISDEHKGQVFLPLEYSIASQMPLSQSGTGSSAAVTKNMLLEMYLEKTRAANKFGTFLTTAGNVLGKLSIPANPYLTAADQFLSFANQTIQSETKDAGAKLFATVNFQFADRDISDVQTCRDAGNEETGAIAVIAATGTKGPNLLTLGNLDKSFCWRYNVGSTYAIQSAPAQPGGCSAVSEAQWAEPSNDYVMLFLSAAVIVPQQQVAGARMPYSVNVNDLNLATQRLKDLSSARALCDSLNLPRKLCGVN